jgi:predicted MFS family arabinose efflux permease
MYVTDASSLKNRLAIFFGLGLQIVSTIFLIRLTVDTGVRLVYPFIPQISAGLGLTIVGFSWLIFVRSVAGITGPLFGVLADRYGRRKIMAAGLLSQSIGLIGLALSWQWWSVAPMILVGFGSTAFIPAQQAYISDQVAYERRGRALAAVDISFAITGIAILPLAGWLIDAFGWRSPFLILSVLSLVATVIIWFRFPSIEHRAHTSLSLSATWGLVFRPNVMASMGVGLLVFMAIGCFMTVWGIWLSADFGLGAVALGLVATTIGVAELSGAGIAGLFIDRIGKQRGSQLGLWLAAVTFLLLLFAQKSLFLTVPVLILLGAFLEFTVVSLFPLFSEQAPEARATIFSLVGLGISIGFAVSSPITAVLWTHVGLWAICAVAISCLLGALILVWRILREQPRSLI